MTTDNSTGAVHVTSGRDALDAQLIRIHGVQGALMLLSDSIADQANELSSELSAALIWTLCRDLDRLCRHLLRNLKWVQSDFRSKKLATRYAFGSPRRPASDWLALRAAPVLHNELDGLSGPFYFVSACATAADFDKTVGPRPPRGSSHYARPLPRPRLPVLLPSGRGDRGSDMSATQYHARVTFNAGDITDPELLKDAIDRRYWFRDEDGGPEIPLHWISILVGQPFGSRVEAMEFAYNRCGEIGGIGCEVRATPEEALSAD